jgi:hypothetical protein
MPINKKEKKMNEIVVAVVYDFVSLLFLSRDLPRL